MLRRNLSLRCVPATSLEAVAAVLSVEKCREALATFKSAKTKANQQAGQSLLRDAFWPEGQRLPVQDACDIIQAAAIFKPELTTGKSRGVHAAVESLEAVPETLTPAQYAAAFSGVTALHHPRQFEVMVRHIRRLGSPDVIETMGIEHLSSIASALGRTGTRHAETCDALARRALALLPESNNVAHVANIAYAFGHTKIDAAHPVWDALAEASTRLVDQSIPLVTATLLNAYGVAWGNPDAPEEVKLEGARALAIAALETSAVSRVKELPPALSSSLALSFARLGRAKMLEASHERMAATVSNFGPAHVADVFRALLMLKRKDTELMGVLAERAATDVRRYKVKDLSAVLETLAAFDLFDAQLTDLAIQQVLATLKSRTLVDINVLANLLRALASAGTRNHVVISAIQRQASETPQALSKVGAENLESALATFSVKPTDSLRERFDKLRAATPTAEPSTTTSA